MARAFVDFRRAATPHPVDVDMGKSACQVPGAVESIEKVRKKGLIGKKRKMAKC